MNILNIAYSKAFVGHNNVYQYIPLYLSVCKYHLAIAELVDVKMVHFWNAKNELPVL